MRSRIRHAVFALLVCLFASSAYPQVNQPSGCPFYCKTFSPDMASCYQQVGGSARLGNMADCIEVFECLWWDPSGQNCQAYCKGPNCYWV